MHKYEAGDKVRIAVDLTDTELYERYDDPGWDWGMRQYVGEIATIHAIMSDPDSTQNKYTLVGNGWYWHEDWLKPISAESKPKQRRKLVI